MRNLMLKLWRDDAGIVALEYLLVATIVGLGLVVGLAAVEGAMDAELTELANAIQSLDQSYSFAGQSSCIASKSGSFAVDAPSSISLKSSPGTGQNINVGNCP
jgi:Flp pilus assembly pilin Flp